LAWNLNSWYPVEDGIESKQSGGNIHILSPLLISARNARREMVVYRDNRGVLGDGKCIYLEGSEVDRYTEKNNIIKCITYRQAVSGIVIHSIFDKWQYELLSTCMWITLL